MRLELTEAPSSDHLRQVSGLVGWEAVDRTPQHVYVSADTDRGLADNADWLLVAALIGAQREQEPRLLVDAPVSASLVAHLRSAQGVLQSWHGERPVPIEAPKLEEASLGGDRATGMFLSGGVDSLSSLLTYVDQIPRGGRDALRYGVNIDLSDEADPRELRPKHRTALDAIRPIADAADLHLLPVVTNLRELGPSRNDAQDWMFRAHGATYAAVAHVLSPLVSRMLIASSYDYPNLVPWGSHPLLDPLYGSSDMAIEHHNAHLSRYAKVLRIRELGGSEAFTSLVVCSFAQRRSADQLPNCGRCEKCLRTLTALIAAGVDGRFLTTFEERTVSVDLIRGLGRFIDRYQFVAWGELVEPLAAAGRGDLSKAVAAKVRSNAFFEFDRKWLGGVAWRTKAAVADPSRISRSVKKRLAR